MINKKRIKNFSYKPTGVEWEYVNLRNISLLQISIWARGLNNPGFYPPLRFHFGNYIGVGVPSEGNHGIFDRKLMERVLKTMQKDIDCTDNFALKLRKRAEFIYSKITKASRSLNVNLEKLSNKNIIKLYQKFKEAMIFSPVILMPMYAVDGCLDEKYHPVKFLKKKIKKEEMGRVLAILSTTTYKTVAFLERESILKIAIRIRKNKIRSIRALEKSRLDKIIEKHILDFQWMHSEYLSETLEKKIYLEEMIKLSKKYPEEELKKMRANAKKALNDRKKLLDEIDFSQR